MISQAKGTGVVGYNVQVAVDTRHHLVVTHEVTNIGNDRTQLSPMAKAARDAMGKKKIKALADRGYFSAPEIKACDDAGIAAMVPKSLTSGAKADGDSTGPTSSTSLRMISIAVRRGSERFTDLVRLSATIR
jgi:hypothetical protein